MRCHKFYNSGNFFMKGPSLRFLIVSIFLSAIFVSGCVYRHDLYQGNFTEQKDVYKLRVGMTPEQVKFVLGTPMLIDPLDTSKWYYINYVRKGWNDPEYQTLVVIFDDDKTVKDIKGDFQKNPKFLIPLSME